MARNNMEIPEYVLNVAKSLHKGGYQAWIVGGSIRDLIIERPAYDYDLATDALPDRVMKLIKRTIPTGIKHGTVTAVTKDGNVEITTFRKDGKYSDARRPDSVTYSRSIQEDLSRRDFTINGIAYDPINGNLLDPFGGREDIKNSIIRTIGDPVERFLEDGLRPLRACRFAAQLDFSIDDETFKAIPQCLERTAMVSVERVRDEFIKIIQSNKPSKGIELMRESGLLNLFIPELLTGYGIDQNRFHRYDIYFHNLYSCDAADPENYALRLAALFHDIGKYYSKRDLHEGNNVKRSVFYNHEIVGAAVTKKILKRLKFSNSDIHFITHLIRNHMFHYTNQWTDGAVRRFIRKVELENLESLFELRKADRIGNGLKKGVSRSIVNLKNRIARVLEEANAITVKDLEVNGHDIMNTFNIEPGPVIGKILNGLLEEILDDPDKNTKETLLRLAENMLSNNRVRAGTRR
jgi:poly(A) polymerase/tRNA nucleotidyltransferase (CCA-adding enzyme)